jgi:DNA-binding MarR family transcriptional regulator
VQLTAKGVRLVDDAVEAHVADEHRVLDPLRPKDRQELVRLLDALLEPLQ